MTSAHLKTINEDVLDGRLLYGDDFDVEEIQRWYNDEERGFYDLATAHYGVTSEGGDYDYEYDALNRFHAFRYLSRFKFERCLAFGCARGDDVAPLAPVVDEFIGIEPVEEWWSDNIRGKPAHFMKPSVRGDIDLPSESVDLVTSLGVLHHIPNVTHVMAELARLLRPGGYFVLREPISWMGDWRRARPGLTTNERGLPLTWIEQTTAKVGLHPVRLRLCQFNALEIAFKRVGLHDLTRSMGFVRFDYCVSLAMSWNVRYRRESFFTKLAPSSVFGIFRRI